MHRNLGYTRRSAAREPIYIPRWALQLKYAGFVVLGVVSGIAGVPSLQEATWRAYTLYWAAALTLAALLAWIGSLRAEWEDLVEKVGVCGISAILSAYTFANVVITATDAGAGLESLASRRVAFTVILVIINMLPLSRALWLLRRTGIRR